MAYKDKDRQREANREWVRQKRAKDKGSTSAGSTDLDLCTTALTDKQILQAWAEGNGNDYQQGLGVLAAQYNAIRVGDMWGKLVLEGCGWKPARRHAQEQQTSKRGFNGQGQGFVMFNGQPLIYNERLPS